MFHASDTKSVFKRAGHKRKLQGIITQWHIILKKQFIPYSRKSVPTIKAQKSE